MKRKKLLLFITIMLAISMMFTACVQKLQPDETDPGGTIDTSTTSDKGSGNDIMPIVKDKLTLKVLMYQGSNPDIIPSGDDPIYKELERLTNIALDIDILPWDDPITRLTAALAAEEYFDIISLATESETFDTFGMEGALIPLRDLIEEHALNMKRAFDNSLEGDVLPYSQNVWSEISASDGNIYYVPTLDSTNSIGEIYAIRDDWLKALNLELPETTDDFYNVLKAFRTNDLNGNNQEDEIPFGFQGGHFTRVASFINGFDAHLSLYVDDADDTIKFGPVEEAWKEGMAYLNMLYKEQLIDNEFRPGESKTRWQSLISANRLGMMHCWPMSGICAANNELKKIDESYGFVPILPLKSSSGKRYSDTSSSGSTVVPGAAAITSWSRYPTEVIKLLDFLYSEEGIILSTYGVESLHYNMVNGNPVFTDLIMDHPEGIDPQSASKLERASIGFSTIHRWDSSIQLMRDFPEVIDAWKLYREPGIVEAPLPKLHFREDELEKGPAIMNEILAYIGKGYVGDKLTAFIVGLEPLDKYDDFVAQIKGMGLEEALRIYNDAYARYKSFSK